MNLKSLFLLLALSISGLLKGSDDAEQLLTQAHSIATQQLRTKIQQLFQNKTEEEIITDATKSLTASFLLIFYYTHYNQQQNPLIISIKNIANKRPDLIQNSFDSYISQEKIDSALIESFIELGAKPYQKNKNSSATPFQKLEARFGSRKIDGIESKNCNGIWSKIFGQSEECNQIKKSLDLCEQKEKTEVH